MAKQKGMAASGLLSEVFQFGIYKRSQGRWSRQITFAAIAVILLIAAWRLYHQTWVSGLGGTFHIAFPLAFALIGMWLTYRLVNLPRFADFLIAVEAEMSKVSWPSRPELLRSSLVVILVIIFMAAVLLLFDTVWLTFFRWLRIVYTETE